MSTADKTGETEGEGEGEVGVEQLHNFAIKFIKRSRRTNETGS